jgi:hypothetical protein
MATGYEDLIPAKSARFTGYDDLIPKQSTSSGIPGPRAPMSLVDQIPGSSVRAPAPTGTFAQPRVAGPRMTGTVVDQIPGYSGPVPAATAQTPRTGSELYRTIRPVVEPTVSALGGVAGGILGAPLGPAGIVGGSGLGYGMAQEALKLGDIYLGGMTPDQAQTQPVRNVVEGAIWETAGRALGPAFGYVGGKIADLRNIPQQRAAKLAKEAVGSDLKAVVNALRASPSDVGVGQATAKFQNPAFQALVKDSLEATPEGAQYLSKLSTMTDDQAVNALSKLVGGRTAADVRATTDLAKQNLNTITTPMREASLGRANIGKYVADEAVAREANDLAVLMGSGSQIDPARFVAQATGAEKALRSVGIKPLEGGPLADQIAGISQNKAYAKNDLIKGAADNVADGIREWTGRNGIIDADALEAIRKNAVDAAIARLRPGVDATTQRNAAASVMTKIKPLIDKAIIDAGGDGWDAYLKTHSKGMQRIAEKKLTGEALDLYKNNKDAFVRLVQNESPEVVEKFLGPNRYNIAVELADSTMSVLRKQASDHLLRVASAKQATEGQKALANLVAQNTSMLRLPSFVNAWAAAGNKTIGELEKRLGQKTMKTLSDAMRSPESAANLLESLPPSERSRVIQFLNNPGELKQRVAVQTIRSGTNALAGEQQNQNALSR